MYEIVEGKDENEERKEWQKRPSIAKFPNAKSVLVLFPNYILSWTHYKQFCVAAESLYQERGLEHVKEALKYYKKHKNDPFIPTITNPMDLDSKWDKLVEYSLKHP